MKPMRMLLPLCLVLAACAPKQQKISLPAPAPSAVSTTRVTAAEMPVAAAFVGEGTLEARGETTPKTKLALERLSVSAVTTGDVAETTIEHVFRNDADERLEGTFRFPVPDRAMLVGLAMEIDGKLMEGELVPRDKARKIYEEIVDQMLDPALLEWENGTTFKLRVFPIEPKQTKRVVLRLVAPLHRGEDGLFFAYRPPTEAGGLSLERVKLSVDGRTVATDEGAKAATGEVLVKVGEQAPSVVTEQTKEGTYVVAHVRPEELASAPDTTRPQALVVVCDRSRSMLEARALQASVLSRLVSALGPADRFTVVAGDVRTRTLGALRPVGEANVKAAAAFVDAVEPDGASDLGKLLTEAGTAAGVARAEGFDPVVVYLGDATPTWGETRTSELEQIARRVLGAAALHVVMLGKSGDETTARALTGATFGRVEKPRTEAEARRVATAIVRSREARRADGVRLEGAEGLDMPLPLPHTLYEGDDVEAAIFVPAGKPPPAALRVVGTSGGKPFAQDISLASAKAARNVGKRWAAAKLAALGREGDAKKDEIVATSLAHGVMSKHTSFLVLESEEAYAKYKIERRAKAEAAAEAAVTAKDVDGSDRTASVTPDHLQPGDPEVRVPAPSDAQSVVVVFPFGETKPAVFESDAQGGAWVARFLVDRSTPDGTYEIVVRITHKDGRVEVLKLPYVVDTKSPKLEVVTERKANGTVVIRAKQQLTAEEVEALGAGPGTIAERRVRHAHILTDAKRVEVRTPDGQVLSLVHVRLGEFVGTWKPAGAASGKLRVVAVDRALNESVTEIDLR